MSFYDESVKLDFSDVLIVPKKSTLESRNDVALERTFEFPHSKRLWTGVPIVVSNMDTTGTVEMAYELQEFQVITCLHKFYKPEDIPDDLNRDYFMISVGTRQEDMASLDKMVEKVRPHFICIDVANGYSTSILNAIAKVRFLYPDITIVAGNVVTPDLVDMYYDLGVDIVKMGIGSGSVCTTRLQTGVGYPQLSCIIDTREKLADGLRPLIMSDGGIQHIGDFSKAFGAGADFVMCGGMFAGHTECSGETIIENGELFKVFYGMSSNEAMVKNYGKVASYRTAEGKCVKIKCKGNVEATMKHILGGIRSTMTYVGSRQIEDLYNDVKFIKVNNTVNNIFK
jgi:GMP reductase